MDVAAHSAVVILCLAVIQVVQCATLFPMGSAWNYTTSSAMSNWVLTWPRWAAVSYNDASWQTGYAPFGFASDSGITTALASGPSVYFFRLDFTTDISSDVTITSALQYEAVDGIVVFANGKVIDHQNVPASGLNAPNGALSCISSTNRNQMYTSTVPSGVILTGNVANTIAVAVFVCSASLGSTTGLLFDMSASYTIDPSTTPSPTPSDSPSATLGTTGSTSTSCSATETTSSSTSITGTGSATGTTSSTVTSTASNTATGSATGTVTTTVTQTASKTATRSATGTVTATVTSSATASASASATLPPTITSTTTSTASSTASESASPAKTGTVSQTLSQSQTSTLSTTPSRTATDTVTTSRSISETPTMTVAPTVTRSVTPTLTAWNATAINHPAASINITVVASISAVCSVIGLGFIIAGIIYFVHMKVGKQDTPSKRSTRSTDLPPNDDHVSHREGAIAGLDAHGDHSSRAAQRQLRYFDADVEMGGVIIPKNRHSSTAPHVHQPTAAALDHGSGTVSDTTNSTGMSPAVRRKTAFLLPQATVPWKGRAASVFGRLKGMQGEEDVSSARVKGAVKDTISSVRLSDTSPEPDGEPGNVMAYPARDDENPMATVVSPRTVFGESRRYRPRTVAELVRSSSPSRRVKGQHSVRYPSPSGRASSRSPRPSSPQASSPRSASLTNSADTIDAVQKGKGATLQRRSMSPRHRGQQLDL